MSNDSRWYVVHTYSGYEKKVAENILKVAENRRMQDEILEVKIPVEIVETIAKKEITTVKADKKGALTQVTGIKLSQKGKNAVIVGRDINDAGVGTMTVRKENGEEVVLKVLDVTTNEKGEEITTISYKKEEEHKIFPGYVMVKIATFLDDNDMPRISDEAWLVVRGTRGATGFVGPEGKPVPLTEEEVYKLGVEERVIEVNYKVGDTVMILADVLEGNTGTVVSIDLENEVVKVVSYAFFGKETSVELGLDQVELVSD